MKASPRKCIIDPQIYSAAIEFTANLERDEWGGIGIGSYTKNNEVLLKGIVFPPQYGSSSTYCSFEAKYLALLKFTLGDLGLFPQVTMVAWVHSHPGHGIFLSDMDRQTFGELIGENERLIAAVIEPAQKLIGAFSGASATEQIEIEKRDLLWKEDQRIRLALLENLLPEMKVIVPPLPDTCAPGNLIETMYVLADKIVRMRKWLATEQLARQASLLPQPENDGE
jgi:hypothetical protein